MTTMPEPPASSSLATRTRRSRRHVHLWPHRCAAPPPHGPRPRAPRRTGRVMLRWCGVGGTSGPPMNSFMIVSKETNSALLAWSARVFLCSPTTAYRRILVLKIFTTYVHYLIIGLIELIGFSKRFIYTRLLFVKSCTLDYNKIYIHSSYMCRIICFSCVQLTFVQFMIF